MQCTHGIEDTIYTLIKISSLSCCLRDSYASRMLHLRPLVISRCLQRVDPFTVAPPAAAPESFTPSVGFDKVKSLPFSCKLHLEIVYFKFIVFINR